MKFGIIGTGWITEAYVDGALDSGLWELSAIYSRSMEKGLDFGKKYGATRVYTELSQLAQSPELEAVYIASPNALHYAHCKAMLEGGKHVICEKPITTHKAEAEELYALAKAKGLILLEAIMYMHLPDRFKLEAAVEKIGKISMASLDFCQRSSKYDAYLKGELPNIFNPKLETGALMDLGIYCLYPALSLFGLPESFTASASLLRSGADGTGIINLSYKGGKLVCLRYSKLGEAGANSDIQGDDGTVYIESISRLANMELRLKNGSKTSISGEEEKFKLMGYEAKDFYRYITEAEKSKAEYENCVQLSCQVADYLERFRRAAGIAFPTD